jgi:hypothetical protein
LEDANQAVAVSEAGEYRMQYLDDKYSAGRFNTYNER